MRNWFSNMTIMDTPYIHEGISYNSSENFYQAMKIPDGFPELRKEIADMSPRDSKKNIRNERYPFRSDWNEAMALRVMEEVLRHKFALGTTWGDMLLKTGDDGIIEWNNWNDLFWGKDTETSEGHNHLGKILMRLRNEFRLQQMLG